MVKHRLMRCFAAGICLAGAGGWAEEESTATSVVVHARYTPVRMQPAGTGVAVAGDATTEDEGPLYWIWKLDATGRLEWKLTFPASRREEVKDLAVRRDGSMMVAGDLFVYDPRAEFKPWTQNMDVDGGASDPVVLDSGGHPAVLLMPDPSLPLIGGARRDSDNPKNNTFDAWMASLTPDGSLSWQKHLDSGVDEKILAGSILRDGSIIWVASAGFPVAGDRPANRFWLLHVSSDGTVLGQATLERTGEITGHGAHLLEGEKGVMVVLSDESDVETEGSAAVVTGFDRSLQQQWEKRLAGFSSILTPVLARTASGECLVIGATAKGPRITALDGNGETLWESTAAMPETDPPSAINVADAVVIDDRLWIVGLTVPVLRPDIAEKVYLLNYSIPTRSVEWVRTCF